MKHEIYGHLRPVSTRRFSAAKYGRRAGFSEVTQVTHFGMIFQIFGRVFDRKC